MIKKIMLLIALSGTSLSASDTQPLDMQLSAALERYDEHTVKDLLQQGASAHDPLSDCQLTPLEKILLLAKTSMQEEQAQKAAGILSLLLDHRVSPNTYSNPDKITNSGTLPVSYLLACAYSNKPVLPLVKVLVSSGRFKPCFQVPFHPEIETVEESMRRYHHTIINNPPTVYSRDLREVICDVLIPIERHTIYDCSKNAKGLILFQ